jgi:uncharacterized RDD family membrane protein YckC
MEPRYPDLKTRIQSTFIDGILMVSLMFLVAWVFDKSGQEEEENGWIKAVIFIGIWCVYEPLSMTLGSTLGNYLMKIRVKKYNNTGKRINLLQAFVRVIFKVALGWVSFITIHTNDERRAIHDIVAGSVMMEK